MAIIWEVIWILLILIFLLVLILIYSFYGLLLDRSYIVVRRKIIVIDKVDVIGVFVF